MPGNLNMLIAPPPHTLASAASGLIVRPLLHLCALMYFQIRLVTSVRAMRLPPQTAASSLDRFFWAKIPLPAFFMRAAAALPAAFDFADLRPPSLRVFFFFFAFLRRFFFFFFAFFFFFFFFGFLAFLAFFFFPPFFGEPFFFGDFFFAAFLVRGSTSALVIAFTVFLSASSMCPVQVCSSGPSLPC